MDCSFVCSFVESRSNVSIQGRKMIAADYRMVRFQTEERDWLQSLALPTGEIVAISNVQ